MLVEDDDAEQLIEVVVKAARTGKIGDGKVWAVPVEQHRPSGSGPANAARTRSDTATKQESPGDGYGRGERNRGLAAPSGYAAARLRLLTEGARSGPPRL
ncbi:hypothetical protein SFUMM280S_11467 [Streptomyces fumanus]